MGISILCALPALARTTTAYLWLHAQLVVASLIVLVLAAVLHHSSDVRAAQVGIAALTLLSFGLVVRAAARLADDDVRVHFGVGVPATERPPTRPWTSRGLVLAAVAVAASVALPAATRSAARWHLAGAPMGVASIAGPNGKIGTFARAMPASRTGSPLALDGQRRVVYLADGDRSELVAIDADQMTVRERRAVGEQPTQLVLGSDGTVFASIRGTGDVVAWSPSGELRRISVGGEPWGLARSDDGATVFVSLAADHEVVALDAQTLAPRWRTAVAERPRALAVTPAGRVLVGHVRHPALSVLDGRSGQRLHELPLVGDGRATPTQAWAFAGADDSMFVFHAQVLPGIDATPALSAGYGGGESEPMVARMTEVDGKRLSVVDVPLAFPVMGPDVRRPFSQPVAAAYVTAGRFAVADLGSDRVHLLSPDGSERVLEVPGGPSALTIDSYGERLLVWTAFDRELRAFQLTGDAPAEQARLSLGASGLPELAERGRRLFHLRDTRISNHGMACASCHPEGRDDGVTWRLEGSRRQTPSLAGRLADTAPYNWLGTQPTLEGNLAQTIKRLGGLGLSAEDTRALVTYIRDYLPAPPHASAHDELVRAGESIFRRRDVGCAGCHFPDAGFSDGLNHDVGTTSAKELRELRSLTLDAPPPAYETPSLRHLALTAPYLHDGSASNLDQLLRATDGAMGHTSQLRKDERRALLAYLGSL
jgi:mono/diheme cytochrome c family protein